MKSIIIYYSKTGTTEKLAKRIQGDFGCDMLKLHAEEPYGNYFSSLVRAKKEQKNEVPVKATNEIPNLSGYDTVFIGYPIWWLEAPVLVTEFIKSCDLEGKTVLPFSTSGLANISGTLDGVKKTCPNSNVILPLQWGIAKKDDYENWVSEVRTALQVSL